MPSGTRLNCNPGSLLEAGPAHLLIQIPARGKIKKAKRRKEKHHEEKQKLQLSGSWLVIPQLTR
jgi:hypothetical protein